MTLCRRVVDTEPFLASIWWCMIDWTARNLLFQNKKIMFLILKARVSVYIFCLFQLKLPLLDSPLPNNHDMNLNSNFGDSFSATFFVSAQFGVVWPTTRNLFLRRRKKFKKIKYIPTAKHESLWAVIRLFWTIILDKHTKWSVNIVTRLTPISESKVLPSSFWYEIDVGCCYSPKWAMFDCY